jgi:hypothetical protein
MSDERSVAASNELAILSNLDCNAHLKIERLTKHLESFVIVFAEKIELNENGSSRLPNLLAFDTQGGGRLGKWNDIWLDFLIDRPMTATSVSPLC